MQIYQGAPGSAWERPEHFVKFFSDRRMSMMAAKTLLAQSRLAWGMWEQQISENSRKPKLLLRPPSELKESYFSRSRWSAWDHETLNPSFTMSYRRVVVTGIGVISPLGNALKSCWENLTSGKSGVVPITQFDASNYDCKIAGEVKEFN